jgi:hypothetical protein
MHVYAAKKDINAPNIRSPQLIAVSPAIWTTLYEPLKKIIGIASKKENLAAAVLSNPNKRAAVMVIPDLDAPGISAIA